MKVPHGYQYDVEDIFGEDERLPQDLDDESQQYVEEED